MQRTGIPTKTTTSAPTAAANAKAQKQTTRGFASQRGRGGGRGGRKGPPRPPPLTQRQKMDIFMNRKLWEIPGTKEYAEMANIRSKWVKQNPHSRMSEFYTMYSENDTPTSKTHYGLSLDHKELTPATMTRSQKRNLRRKKLRLDKRLASASE